MESKNEQLKIKYALQKSALFQCIHNLQSPLSASSGYLELMEIALSTDVNIEKLSRYKNNIESGVTQISDIVKQIQALYEFDFYIDTCSAVVVDLHWLLSEVSYQSRLFIQFKKQQIEHEFVISKDNMHVCSNLCLLKLFLYNLIATISRYTAKESGITISVHRQANDAIITFKADIFERSPFQVLDIFISDEFSTYAQKGRGSNPVEESPRNKALEYLGGRLYIPDADNGSNSIVLVLPLALNSNEENAF